MKTYEVMIMIGKNGDEKYILSSVVVEDAKNEEEAEIVALTHMESVFRDGIRLEIAEINEL